MLRVQAGSPSLSSEGSQTFEQVLHEIRTAPVLARDTRAGAVAMSLVVFTFLNSMLDSVQGLLVVASVLAVHELGHYLAMRAFGYCDLDVLFIPLPASLPTKERSGGVWQDVVVLLLGPLPGLLGAALLARTHPGAEQLSRHSLAWQVLVASAYINGSNLLPLIPFDGGNAARILFFAERPATQARVGSALALMVGLVAVLGHRWDVGVFAGFAFLFGVVQGGPCRVAEQFRNHRVADLATAPRLAKDAPETLLQALFEDWKSAGHNRTLPPRDLARFLSLAYSAAVTPAMSMRHRVVLGIVYVSATVPLAFWLVDLLMSTPFG